MDRTLYKIFNIFNLETKELLIYVENKVNNFKFQNINSLKIDIFF